MLIVKSESGRVKLFRTSDASAHLATLRRISAAPLSIVYRARTESAALANAIMWRARSKLADHRLPGEWFAVEPVVAKRALVEAIIEEDEGDKPCIILAGKKEIPVSPELAKRVQKLASRMDLPESEIFNRILVEYCRKLKPNEIPFSLFYPGAAEDVAEKIFSVLNVYEKSKLPRSVLLRRKGFSEINREVLDAAIQLLVKQGRVSFRRNSLSLTSVALSELKRRSRRTSEN